MRNRLFNVCMAPDGGTGAGAGTGSAGTGAGASGSGEGAGAPGAGQQNQTPAFDYEKLASLVAGKQTVTEESVLKGYFKQQGLSREQMEQAITAFKQQQAAQQPDVSALQTQAQEAKKAAQQALIEKEAVMEAAQLGIDAKTIPYVLKMADLNAVLENDGKINKETLKNALNKVLEDVPALKPQAGNTPGFRIGAIGSEQHTGTSNAPLSLKDAISEALKN